MSNADLLPALAKLLCGAVDHATRQRASLHVLDWLACCAAAQNHALALTLSERTCAAPVGNVAAWSAGYRTPEAALLLNGALGNLQEMDDVHRGAILHPGPVVIPAALACCTAMTTGKALLDAIVRGYEVMIRIGRAIGRSHYQYWHPTSTCGAFGAAAACASLLSLDPRQTAYALGSAGSRTGGLWQMRHEDVPSKSLHNAEAARAGWLAAELAARGVRGPLGILDGPQGLFAATSRDADPAQVLAEAADWLIHEVSFKPWPACRHVHPAIDALLALLPAAQASEVVLVELHTYREALEFCDLVHPLTELEARFSLQHALAAVLTYGRPRFEHYAARALSSAPVSALRARVTLAEDPIYTARFPHHFGARLKLTLANGECLQHSVTDAWGDPEWPLDESDLAAKSDSLMRWGGLGSARIGSLLDAVHGLHEHDCSALLAAIAGPA